VVPPFGAPATTWLTFTVLSLTSCAHFFMEYQMSEVSNLNVMRAKLVNRRRRIAASFAEETSDGFNGDTIRRGQEAIDAIDRAIADEQRSALRDELTGPETRPIHAIPS
jgi:hypothetical protein